MRNSTPPGPPGSTVLPVPDAKIARDRWEPPTVEVICLACEISAYAPDGDLPLL